MAAQTISQHYKRVQMGKIETFCRRFSTFQWWLVLQHDLSAQTNWKHDPRSSPNVFNHNLGNYTKLSVRIQRRILWNQLTIKIKRLQAALQLTTHWDWTWSHYIKQRSFSWNYKQHFNWLPAMIEGTIVNSDVLPCNEKKWLPSWNKSLLLIGLLWKNFAYGPEIGLKIFSNLSPNPNSNQTGKA